VALVEDAVDRYGTVYTLHEIVHNQQVMDRLREKGVRLASSLSDIPEGATVALTAHGAPMPLIAGIRARGLTLVDTTCPIVGDAQRVVADNVASGRFTVIYGDRDHLEVRGLLSQASGSSLATESLDGLEVPFEGKLAVVGQTTKSPEALRVFAKDLIGRLGGNADILVQDTTCLEPVARYHAARRLASRRDIDGMVVVGSSASANTRNLLAVCQESGKPSLFVTSAEDINPAELRGFSRVGLTAGASTPDWCIDAVERELRRL
jgi:4-hydroxy-3-methylbut-2-enyl diphosphate reductase